MCCTLVEQQLANLDVGALGTPGRVPPGRVPPGRIPPGRIPPGRVPPGRVPPGRVPPGRIPPGRVPPGRVPPGRVLNILIRLPPLPKDLENQTVHETVHYLQNYRYYGFLNE